MISEMKMKVLRTKRAMTPMLKKQLAGMNSSAIFRFQISWQPLALISC